MSGLYKSLVEENQIISLRRVLKKALNYHFSHFVKLERLGEPYSLEDRMGKIDFQTRFQANTTIKFEVQAYICQFRRLRHFIKYFQRQGIINEPRESEMKVIWRDLMENNGVVNLLANKWATHRSADDPRKEDTELLHLEVLLNLDGPVTMWGNGHIFLSIDKYAFYLFDYHPKALKFVDWVFEVIENNLKRKK